MNKTKIQWTDKTWKIVEGCSRNCSFCYVRRFKTDMTPTFYPDRLSEPLRLQKRAVIFVANTGDLFDPAITDNQINQIIGTIKKCPQHVFQLLTKNTARLLDFEFPKNVWAGTTITCQDDLFRIDLLKQVKASIKFLSIEPILNMVSYPSFSGIDWIIIGPETAGNASNPKDVKSAQQFAAPLIKQILSEGIPLFLKPSLQWPVAIEQFPAVKDPQIELPLGDQND